MVWIVKCNWLNHHTQKALKKSPIHNLTTPIFLEHTAQIIGWCRLAVTNIGLEVEEGII